MAYFISMFVIAKSYVANIDIVTGELNAASTNEAQFSLLQNT
jgi:hypothetical protein